MTTYSQDVADAPDSQTLSKGKFRLWVPTQLDTFVHSSNDVCLAQELVRDVLPRSDCDSERDASSGYCGDFGHVLHVVSLPLRRCCTQLVNGVKDLRFLQVSLRSDFGVGDVNSNQIPKIKSWDTIHP